MYTFLCIHIYVLGGYCSLSMEDIIHMKVIGSRPVTGYVITHPNWAFNDCNLKAKYVKKETIEIHILLNLDLPPMIEKFVFLF